MAFAFAEEAFFAEFALADATASTFAVEAWAANAAASAGSFALGPWLMQAGQSMAINMALGALTGRAQGAQASDISAARAQGLLINASSNIEPIPVLIGHRRLGGPKALIEVSSKKTSKAATETTVVSGVSPTYTVAHTAGFVDAGASILTGNEIVEVYAPLFKVVGTPAAGQYTVSAGVYTFAAADAGAKVQMAYSYDATADDHQYLTRAIVWSHGPITGVDQIYIDDASAAATRYADVLTLETHLGATDQAASPLLKAELGDRWSDAHQGKGLAYTAVRCEFDLTAFPSGEPTVTADLRGILLYDPRTLAEAFGANPALAVRRYLTSTDFGRGLDAALMDDDLFAEAANICDERVSVPSKTWAVTVDPANNWLLLPAVDWTVQTGDGVRFTSTGTLPGGLAANTTYYAVRLGLGQRIALAATPAAAMAHTLIDITSAGSGTVSLVHWDEARYTANGVIDVDASIMDNLMNLLTACRGYLVRTGAGKWGVIVDAPVDTSAAFEFSEDNIVGGWSITRPGIKGRFNRINAQWFSAAKNWQPDKTLADEPLYRTDDNGELLEATVDLPYTTSSYMAQRLAWIELEDSRRGLQVRFRALQEGLRAEVGDVVKVTHSLPGWSGALFRVLRITVLDTHLVEVELRQYDPDVYAGKSLQAAPDPIESSLGNPLVVAAPESLTLASGTAELLVQADGTVVSRLHVAWPATTDRFVTAGEVQIKKSADSAWATVARPQATDTDTWIAPVADGESYDVRMRWSNVIGATSDWTTASGHVVIGKTEPPGDITDLTIAGTLLAWTMPTDADLAGVQLRFAYGSSSDWGTATPLHAGLLTASPWALAARPSGTVTIMAKAFDTSGNESATAAVVVTNLGDAPTANVVESWDFKAAAFPGDYSAFGSSVDGAGDLVADEVDSFFGADTASFYYRPAFYAWADYIDKAVPKYGATAFTWLLYETTEVVVTTALAGSMMTLQLATEGYGITVEYRLTAPGSRYGEDTASFYAETAGDPFYPDVPGDWMPWPGQIETKPDGYQWRVSMSGTLVQSKITGMVLVVDAPSITEDVADLAIDMAGTTIPHSARFTAITSVQATLQSGTSGALSVEIDKTAPLAPVITAYNASHAAVAGATADITLRGY